MPGLYQILIAMVFNGVDLLSGIIAALKNHDLKSSALRDGLFKKVGFIICYLLAWLLDYKGADIGIEISVKILPIIVIYVVWTEVVSIIENVCDVNPDLVPEQLKKLFHVTEGVDK